MNPLLQSSWDRAWQNLHARGDGHALWFHDAVYDPRASDNEERSAAWAGEELLGAGVPADSAARVHDLVMVTKHTGLPRGRANLASAIAGTRG